MTKEQAIKNLLEIVELSKDEIKNENKNINATLDYEDLKSLQIALSTIKEKDKEIEHQIEKRDNQKAELAILNEKQKKMNKLINIVKSYKGQIKKLEHTNKSYKGMIKKKDKQINYMANFINDNMPYTKDLKELENEEGIRTAEFTTKYFERKSEE